VSGNKKETILTITQNVNGHTDK